MLSWLRYGWSRGVNHGWSGVGQRDSLQLGVEEEPQNSWAHQEHSALPGPFGVQPSLSPSAGCDSVQNLTGDGKWYWLTD